MARRTATNDRQVPETRDLAELSKAAASCKACDLWKRGTQTVYGEGKRSEDDDARHAGMSDFVDDLKVVGERLRRKRAA